MNSENLLPAFVIVVLVLCVIFLVFFFRWTIKHRVRYSLKDLRQNLKVLPENSLSPEDRDEITGLVSGLTQRQATLNHSVRRYMWTLIITVALIGACFAPTSTWTHVAIVAATVVFVLISLFGIIIPGIHGAQANARANARIQEWLNAHPQFSEKPPKHGVAPHQPFS